jgi:glycosyltransferase involved in cell wall biosynthesis
MRILTSLTYYRPHFSGLTIYAERLARALARRGHQVTVLTSRYSPDLLTDELCDGVEVVRLPVRLRISKGVIMPSMLWRAWKAVQQSDIVHLHLPQFDAALIALYARLQGKPVVLTYHCDLLLPRGFVNALANLVSNFINHISALLSQAIITNTQDYAESSPFLRGYLKKVGAIYVPVELTPVTPEDIEALRQKAHIQPGQRIISMVARLASEKGVEYLAHALPAVMDRHPGARVLYGGQHRNVWGETEYAQRLAPLIEQLGERWQFLGIISEAEKSALYHLSDVVTVPSLNSTESIGISQVEAMTCGTPVVASDLPGVRLPVQLTGMGLIVPPGDSHALAQAISTILDNPEQFGGDSEGLKLQFSSDTIAGHYETLFQSLSAHDQ